MAPRACLVRHRYYPGDPRMENQIQALRAVGYEVDVFCLRRRDEPRTSVENGVNVFRSNVLERKRAGRLRYLAEYGSFWLAALWFLTRRQLTHRYELITVQTLPDFLSFSALFAKLLGAKVIVDMRECTPEMYHSTFDVDLDHPIIRVISAVEQLSIRFADAALTCTEQMREAFVQRGADPARISVMLNTPDPTQFDDAGLPDVTGEPHNPFRIVIHGTIKERYGHETLIRAMARLVKDSHPVQLDILGDGPLRPELEGLVDELALNDVVRFLGFVPDEELMQRLRQADCGVVPLIRTPETELIHTFKMYEYLALGIPVAISRTRAVDAYLDDSQVCFVEPGSVEDLARAISKLQQDAALRHRLAKNALDWYRQHSPAQQRTAYLKVVASLVGRRLVTA